MENAYHEGIKTHHWNVKIIGLAMLLLFFSRLPLSFADTDHGFITTYEGSKTCRTCHEAAVDDLTHAVHYRLLGNVQGVYDMFTNKPVTGEKGKGNRY
jgi:hypothetical protein